MCVICYVTCLSQSLLKYFPPESNDILKLTNNSLVYVFI